jgi:hypothetical protein
MSQYLATYQINKKGKIQLIKKGELKQFIAYRNKAGKLSYPVKLTIKQ